MRMSMRELLRISVLSAACLSLNACAKESVESVSTKPNVGLTECVGRSQIELPGEVDFALSNIREMMRVYPATSGSNPEFVFSDGSIAGDSIVFNGYQVTKNVSESDYTTYLDSIVTGWKRFYAEEVSKSDKKSHLLKYPPPEKIGSHSLVKRGPYGATLHTYKGNRIYSIGEGDYSKTRSGKEIAASIVKNFTTREAYETPPETGVCFPFGFMKDDGKGGFAVGVGMRLMDHPDVEVIFSDSHAQPEAANLRDEYKGSLGKVRKFWSFYGPSEGNKLDGTVKHFHDVDLGGYKGIYATATIARPLSTPDRHGYETQEQYATRVKREMTEGKYPLDYGYMAYYKGDPNKPDEPEFMLSVIRTASRAVEAGKTPVTQEELYAMAKRIAASIKRRPIQ